MYSDNLNIHFTKVIFIYNNNYSIDSNQFSIYATKTKIHQIDKCLQNVYTRFSLSSKIEHQ